MLAPFRIGLARRRYQRQGYVVVSRFISPALIREMRENFLAQTSRETPSDLQQIPHAIQNLLGERSGPLLAEIQEYASKLQKGPVKHHLNQLFFRPPHCPTPTPWHQDSAYYAKASLDDGPHGGITAWFPLSEVSAEKPYLEMIPKSHLKGVIPHSDISHQYGNQFLSGPLETQGKLTHSVPLRMAEGDVVFFSAYTVHGAGANQGTRPSYGMSVHMFGGRP